MESSANQTNHNLIISTEYAIPASITYLNSAGHCVLPLTSQSLGTSKVMEQSMPWYGYGNEVQDMIDIRSRFATMIHAESMDCIATSHSTSLAISTAVFNVMKLGYLDENAKVLVLNKDMASAVMPWQYACDQTGAKLVIVRNTNDVFAQNDSNRLLPSDSEIMAISWTDAVLRTIDSIQDKLRVVCLPHVHWCDGSLIDLERISSRLDAFPESERPLLIVDGTQSLGAMTFNVDRIKPSFVACSIHKWLNGPFGMSLIYLAPQFHSNWVAIDHHERNRVGSDQAPWDALGAMISSTTVDGNPDCAVGYPTKYFSGARRIDSGGHSNPITVAMIRNSLGLILELGVESIQEKCRKLTNLIYSGLQSLPEKYKQLFCVLPGHERCGHILGIRFTQHWKIFVDDGSDDLDVLSIGEFLCSFLKRNDIYVVMRGGCIRVSVYIFNTNDDVAKFISFLQRGCEEFRASRLMREPSMPPPPPPVSLPPQAPFDEPIVQETLVQPNSLSQITPKPYHILITGSAGWLGQFVWSTLQETKAQFRCSLEVFAGYSTSVPDWVPEENRVNLNLEDEASVREVIGRIKPDCVLHLAAMASPVACAADPARALRINCCTALVEAITEYCPSSLLLFTSTDLVYDGDQAPYECPSFFPSDEPQPKNVYGSSKLAMEKLVNQLPFGVVLRLSNMVGPYFKYKACGVKFLQFLYSSCNKREVIGLKDDERRSFVYVYDVVEIMMAFCRQHCNAANIRLRGVYNMGGPEGLSRLELAAIMCESLRCKMLIEGETEKNVPTINAHSAFEDSAEDSNMFDLIGAAARNVEDRIEYQGEPWVVRRQNSVGVPINSSAVINPLDVTMNSVAISCLFDKPLTRMKVAISRSLSASKLQ